MDEKGGLAAAGTAMNRTILKNILKAPWCANWPGSILLFMHIFCKSKQVTSLLHTSHRVCFSALPLFIVVGKCGLKSGVLYQLSSFVFMLVNAA